MTNGKDLFICGICKASFSCDSFTRFMEHKMLHMDATKKIHCSLCLKSFPKRNALQIHLERVHSIPQRTLTSDNSLSNTTLASSSARCKPCSSLNSLETESNEKPDSCFHVAQNRLHLSSHGVSLSQQQPLDGCAVNGSPENSNLSIDVITNDDPTIEFPLNTLNYYEDVCCNRLLTSDEVNGEIDGDFAQPATFSSGLGASKFTILKQNNEDESKNVSSAACKDNDERLNNSFEEKDVPESMCSELKDDVKSTTKKEDNKKEEEMKTEKDNVDFHFLLGSTTISGNSMTYERVELRCMHCSFSSAWRPSLIKHMKIAHSDVLAFHEFLDIQTATSTKPSSNQNELSKRYKIMKLSEHSKMTLRNKTRKVKRLARAVEYQDVPGKYACPICNKVFSRMRYIRRHQMTHKTQRAYLCDHCGKSFKTRSTLVAHSRSHDVKIYHCPQCDFVSNLTGAIHRHRQLHPSGSAVCEICGSVYTDKSTLKKHMRVHDPNRQFACLEPNCTWRFRTENLMKAHVKSHTVVGKFQCIYCGYRFRHKHHLQRHISRIHPQEILLENSNAVSLIPSSNTSHTDQASGLSVSDMHQKQQDSGSTFNSSNQSNQLIQSVFHSDSGISLESGTQTQTVPCGDQSNLQAQECSKQPLQQNMIQVLVNNNGQEIVISLPPDINPEIMNNMLI